jgi:hypothetical protein
MLHPVLAFLAGAPLLACGARDGRRPPNAVQTTSAPAAAPGGTTRVSAPPSDASERPLAARQIHEGVAKQMGAVRQHCAKIERKIDRYEATLHLEIAASGRVEIARARGNHPIVDACVSDVAQAWEFPASGGRSIADVPIMLLRVDD